MLELIILKMLLLYSIDFLFKHMRLQEDAAYVAEQYCYVLQHYDGAILILSLCPYVSLLLFLVIMLSALIEF